jgi:hypothetical protein
VERSTGPLVLGPPKSQAGRCIVGIPAAMIYQHEARGADKAITDAIDKRVDDEQPQDDGDDGPAGVPA